MSNPYQSPANQPESPDNSQTWVSSAAGVAQVICVGLFVLAFIFKRFDFEWADGMGTFGGYLAIGGLIASVWSIEHRS